MNTPPIFNKFLPTGVEKINKMPQLARANLNNQFSIYLFKKCDEAYAHLIVEISRLHNE